MQQRDFYEFKTVGGKVIAMIDRTFADDIAVKLPCGYYQRFWADYTDKQAVKVIRKMKRDGIKSI